MLDNRVSYADIVAFSFGILGILYGVFVVKADMDARVTIVEQGQKAIVALAAANSTLIERVERDRKDADNALNQSIFELKTIVKDERIERNTHYDALNKKLDRVIERLSSQKDFAR